MKCRLLIVILLLIFVSSGCTYFEYLTNLGEKALYQGDLTKAESFFTDLQEYAPHSHKSYLYLGFIYLYRDMPEKAIENYKISLKYNKQPDLEYLGLGHAYLAIQEYDLAREYLEKSREVSNYPLTDYLLGFIYLQDGDKQLAKSSFSTASKAYPERGEIWSMLGKLFLENSQIIDAAQAYQMAYVHGIRNYELYVGLAESYFQLGNFRHAIAVTEQALTEQHISADEKELLRLKLAQYNMNQNPSKAVESLESILKTNPNKPEVQLMLGQLYFQQEEYQKSLSIFNQYLKYSPPLAQVIYLMYKSHLFLKNNKLAERYLLDAIDLKPKNLTYYIDLINFYHSENRLKEAIPTYQKAIELDPDNEELIKNLIGVYFVLEDLENAIMYLRKAIQINPRNYDLYLLKAYAHYRLNQVDAEEATYEMILKLSPNHLVALNNLAQVKRDTNRLDEAYELYQKALRLDSNDSRYHRNLGYILLLKNDYSNAREWFKKAIEKNPEDYESYRFLGDTYFVNDQYNEAIAAYQISLQIKPDYPHAMYPLGKSYFYLNELDKAKEYFLAYQRYFPKNDSSKFYLTRIEWLKNQKSPDIEILPAIESSDQEP